MGTQEQQRSEQKPQNAVATTMKDGSGRELDLSSVNTDDAADAHNSPDSIDSLGQKNTGNDRCRFRDIASDSSVMISSSEVAGLKRLIGDVTLHARATDGKGLRQAEKSAQINAPTPPLPSLCG